MKVLHWSELPGNKYSLKIDSAMLNNCFFAEQSVRRVGSKRSDPPQKFYVHYDRDYVIKKIFIDVIEPLKITSVEELIALVTDCWQEGLGHENYKVG